MLRGSIVSNRSVKVSVKAAVNPEWQTRFGDVLSSAGIDVDFCTDGEVLARRLASDWTVDVVILDLALATPALAARLGPGGPRLLAFGAPDYSGIAFTANLADFIDAAPTDADLVAAVHAAAAAEPPAGVADLSDRSVARLGALGAEATRIADALARLAAPPAAPGADRPRPVARDDPRAAVARPVLPGRSVRRAGVGHAARPRRRRGRAARRRRVEPVHRRRGADDDRAALDPRLCDAGLFERRDDPRDARRAFISLSEGALAAMARYLAATPG